MSKHFIEGEIIMDTEARYYIRNGWVSYDINELISRNEFKKVKIVIEIEEEVKNDQ